MKNMCGFLPAVAWSVLLALHPADRAHAQQAVAAGAFESHGDVGTVLHPGSVAYDATKKSYTIAGSGENMWFGADAFQFARKKISGDATLSADISFLGSGGNAHRKAVLMIRQSLDADSVYADIALHGNGLTSLQFRDEKGGFTHEVQSPISAPKRLRIEKHGAYFTMWLSGETGELVMACFRETDVKGRFGGDEFVVAGQFSMVGIELAATRLKAAAEERSKVAGRKYPLSLSIGCVTLDHPSNESLKELVRRADEAMYRDKRSKRVARA